MAKETLMGFRIGLSERRAVKRFARCQGVTVTELFRRRIVVPAMGFDPRQTPLPLWEKEDAAHASRP